MHKIVLALVGPVLILICGIFQGEVYDKSVTNNSVTELYNLKVFPTYGDSLSYSNTERIFSLENSVDSIINNSQLKRYENNLAASNNIIAGLSGYVSSFSIIIGILALIIAIVSLLILIPLLKRAREVVRESEKAQAQIESKIRDLDVKTGDLNQLVNEKLNERFTIFEAKQKKRRMDEIIENLSSPHKFQREDAEVLISTIDVSEVSIDQIYKFFKTLNSDHLSKGGQYNILEILIKLDEKSPNEDIRNNFMNWNRFDDEGLRILIPFYYRVGIQKFLGPISSFIFSKSAEHLKYMELLPIFHSYGNEGLLAVINDNTLNRGLSEYAQEVVWDYLQSEKNRWGLEKEIEESLIGRLVRQRK